MTPGTRRTNLCASKTRLRKSKSRSKYPFLSYRPGMCHGVRSLEAFFFQVCLIFRDQSKVWPNADNMRDATRDHLKKAHDVS